MGFEICKNFTGLLRHFIPRNDAAIQSEKRGL